MNAGLFGLPTRNGGSLVLLEEQTARNSPCLDFVSWYSPEFDVYEIHVVDVLPVGTGANLNVAMRCSSDGGVTFDAGNNYSWIHLVHVVGGSGTGGLNATSYIGLVIMGSTNTNWGACGVFHFHNPAGTRYKQLHGTAAEHDASRGATDVEDGVVAGAYLSVRPVNALRFLISAGASGNILSGTIRIYGVAKK